LRTNTVRTDRHTPMTTRPCGLRRAGNKEIVYIPVVVHMFTWPRSVENLHQTHNKQLSFNNTFWRFSKYANLFFLPCFSFRPQSSPKISNFADARPSTGWIQDRLQYTAPQLACSVTSIDHIINHTLARYCSSVVKDQLCKSMGKPQIWPNWHAQMR